MRITVQIGFFFNYWQLRRGSGEALIQCLRICTLLLPLLFSFLSSSLQYLNTPALSVRSKSLRLVAGLE